MNGALGYGVSSITMPVGLLFYPNRLLNPVLVLIEVFVNLYVLATNRRSIPVILSRVAPIVIGLVPMVVVGSLLLRTLDPHAIRIGTYAFLLPLVFLQLLGFRRPVTHPVARILCGAGIGTIYSLTTISGPPLAVIFNNEGLVKRDFRAALALIRSFESIVAAVAYASLGIITPESLQLLKWIAPGVVIGIPLGAIAINKMNADTFRRICMGFDILIIVYGLWKALLA